MYPQSWHDGTPQAWIRHIAGYRCEHCGMVFRRDGSNLALFARRRDGRPFVGTTHHINGDKSDVSYANLAYLCQRCHLHVQALWAPGEILPNHWLIGDQPPAWIAKRRLPYRLAVTQLKLFEMRP